MIESRNYVLLALALVTLAGVAEAQTKYVRYEHNGATGYGVLSGDTISELAGNFLETTETTGKTIALADAKLLAPVEPRQVFAVGFNYQSHLGGREAPADPPIFLKLPSSIIGPGDEIVLPDGARMVQYEAELVLVIGKETKNVSAEDASDYIFGVTCGNDVSARVWQQSDLQWFRGKASDTFGPIGPAVVTGLNYDDLLLQGRLNGETGQKQRTSDLIHDTGAIIEFISDVVTLLPGDVIFTGTPGSTKTMESGNVVEIEVEGVGVLSNPVIAEADAAAADAPQAITAERVMQMMDTDGDGKITEEEAPDQLKASFALVDSNGDGGIDVGEAQLIADFMGNNQ